MVGLRGCEGFDEDSEGRGFAGAGRGSAEPPPLPAPIPGKGIYPAGTVSARHHYVSLFHLRQFVDPASESEQTPWVWHGSIPDGPVKRRSPKRVGTGRAAFDGPGGLRDRTRTIESFLSHEVESPAAAALREMCARPSGSGGDLPAELSRYLAWAAARSEPMRTLEAQWAASVNPDSENYVEPAPEWIAENAIVPRAIRLKHPTEGARVLPPEHNAEDVRVLMRDGWFPDPEDRDNFLEMVHIQAWYFQRRFFPRLKWHTLHAPPGQQFVIGDRAVGWAADGMIDAPPSALRHPTAYVLAPLSRDLVLVGRHTTDRWYVTPAQINQIVAAWSHEWIVGPSETVVEEALIHRKVTLA